MMGLEERFRCKIKGTLIFTNCVKIRRIESKAKPLIANYFKGIVDVAVMKNAIFDFRSKCCFIQERTRIWLRLKQTRTDYFMHFFLKEF